MDRGDWRAIVHRVAKSQTQLKQLAMHVPLGGPQWTNGQSFTTKKLSVLREMISSFTFQPNLTLSNSRATNFLKGTRLKCHPLQIFWKQGFLKMEKNEKHILTGYRSKPRPTASLFFARWPFFELLLICVYMGNFLLIFNLTERTFLACCLQSPGTYH